MFVIVFFIIPGVQFSAESGYDRFKGRKVSLSHYQGSRHCFIMKRIIKFTFPNKIETIEIEELRA